MPKSWDNINLIVKYSLENRNSFRSEFTKLCNYFDEHPNELIMNLLDIKGSIENPDYYSDLLDERAREMLENINNPKYKLYNFNENYILDSLQKIYTQIKDIPIELIQENEEVKIFFYSLSDQIKNNSRLMLCLMRVNVKEFYELYFVTNN